MREHSRAFFKTIIQNDKYMKRIIRKLIAWAYPDAEKFMTSIRAVHINGTTFSLDANLVVEGSLSSRHVSDHALASERDNKVLKLDSGKS